MGTNMIRERDIRLRLDHAGYPQYAQDDIRWLLAETERLREACVKLYKDFTEERQAATNLTVVLTRCRADHQRLHEIITQQSTEIGELRQELRMRQVEP